MSTSTVTNTVTGILFVTTNLSTTSILTDGRFYRWISGLDPTSTWISTLTRTKDSWTWVWIFEHLARRSHRRNLFNDCTVRVRSRSMLTGRPCGLESMLVYVGTKRRRRMRRVANHDRDEPDPGGTMGECKWIWILKWVRMDMNMSVGGVQGRPARKVYVCRKFRRKRRLRLRLRLCL